METPKIDSAKYKSSLRGSSQDVLAQIVAMKAYFMNEIQELKNEICFLKSQLEDGGETFRQYFRDKMF